MSGQKRCHEADSGRLSGHNEFTQAKKSRVTVDSNYLALANTLDARLDTLTRRIEHMLTQLNNRLGNLESTVHTLASTIDAMQVTVCDTVAMATGSHINAMDTGSPMDIGTPSRGHAQYTTYYA